FPEQPAVCECRDERHSRVQHRGRAADQLRGVGSPGTSIAGSVTINSSDVQGGWPGTGNIDSDPMFTDPSGRSEEREREEHSSVFGPAKAIRKNEERYPGREEASGLGHESRGRGLRINERTKKAWDAEGLTSFFRSPSLR